MLNDNSNSRDSPTLLSKVSTTTRSTTPTRTPTTPNTHPFQTKSILRNPRSSASHPTNKFATSSSHQTSNQPSASSTTSTSKRKFSGFFKKVSIEWNLFILKLKSISEEVFVTDELVEDLFEDVDSDDTLDRLSRAYRGFNSGEEKFLQDYKKYKSLDGIYQAHQRELVQHKQLEQPLPIQDTMPVPNTSNNTAVSSAVTSAPSRSRPSLQYQLQDVIRHSADNLGTRYSNDIDDDNDDNDDLISNEATNDTYDDNLTFNDIDVVKLREQFLLHLKKLNELYDESTESSSKSTSAPEPQHKITPNVGETIWEYRRSKWLKPSSGDVSDVERRLDERKLQSSLKHIPKDSYAKIYSAFVDKGKELRSDKRINLSDLIQVINAGWISEEKWQRAAKGLA